MYMRTVRPAQHTLWRLRAHIQHNMLIVVSRPYDQFHCTATTISQVFVCAISKQHKKNKRTHSYANNKRNRSDREQNSTHMAEQHLVYALQNSFLFSLILCKVRAILFSFRRCCRFICFDSISYQNRQIVVLCFVLPRRSSHSVLII